MKALERLDKEKAAENRERPLREEVTERHTARHGMGNSRRALLIGAGAGVALTIGLVFGLSGALTGTPNEVRDESLPASLVAVSSPSGTDRATPVGRSTQVAPEGSRLAPPRSTTNLSTAVKERAPATQENEESLPPSVDEVRELTASALAAEVALLPPAEPVVPKVTSPVAPEREAEATRIPARAGLEPETVEPESKPAAPASSASVALQRSSRKATAPSQPEAPALETFDSAIDPLRVSALPVTALRDVRVARTIWHPTPDRRYAFVEVSGQAGSLRVREGDRVGRLGVKTIEPWGVVFLDDGVEIRYRVGGRK